MFRDTLTVYKKEIKSILKDKTVLFMCVLLPFIFMFGEGKLMTAMGDSEENARQKTYDAYFINAPEDIKDGLLSIGFKGDAADADKCIEDIKNKNADMLVVFPEDFKIASSETGAVQTSKCTTILQTMTR